jgi:hypothetical protein
MVNRQVTLSAARTIFATFGSLSDDIITTIGTTTKRMLRVHALICVKVGTVRNIVASYMH